MPLFTTGKGKKRQTVEARQFLNAYDQNLAYWAEGVLQGGRNGNNTIRIYRPEATIYVNRYDWIVKDEDGTIRIESPESFRDNYTPLNEETQDNG